MCRTPTLSSPWWATRLTWRRRRARCPRQTPARMQVGAGRGRDGGAAGCAVAVGLGGTAGRRRQAVQLGAGGCGGLGVAPCGSGITGGPVLAAGAAAPAACCAATMCNLLGWGLALCSSHGDVARLWRQAWACVHALGTDRLRCSVTARVAAPWGGVKRNDHWMCNARAAVSCVGILRVHGHVGACVRAYAAETGLLYFETSAKANINVAQLFDEVADK